MYNPEVMKQAQEMMSKMTPAQREKMMEMQRNMSPEMLQAAQRNMASMNPDMMKQAMQGGNFERSLEQMEKMSPEEMERRTAMAAAMGGGASAPAPAPTPRKPSTDPAVVKAVKLKETGTGLLKNKDLDGARAQYAAAVEALEEATDTEGKRPVWAACQLNMAHVFLEQQNWKRAAAVCDLVIDSSSAMADPATKLKAHYRRGRARKGLEKFAEAAADLQVAQTMAPPAQLPPIQALLAQVKASLPSSGGGDSNSSSSSDGAAIPRGKGGARIEEITEDDEEGASSSSTGATSSSSSSSATPGGVPNMGSMAQQMANMNPEVMKQQMEMMDKMDDAQLEQMAKMQASMRPGMPVMSAAQMRSQMSMMKNMDPEMMKSMAAMAGQMGGGAGGTSAAGGRPAASPEAAAEMMKNMSPDQMKKMAESMKNMDPEMLKSAAKAAGMDMPNIDPAQMAQAAEAMGKMSPEQMEKMMVWAQRGQKCLSACAYPIKAFTFVKNLIPAQFRRSVLMAVVAAVLYWLFLSGSSTPAAEPAQGQECYDTYGASIDCSELAAALDQGQDDLEQEMVEDGDEF